MEHLTQSPLRALFHSLALSSGIAPSPGREPTEWSGRRDRGGEHSPPPFPGLANAAGDGVKPGLEREGARAMVIRDRSPCNSCSFRLFFSFLFLNRSRELGRLFLLVAPRTLVIPLPYHVSHSSPLPLSHSPRLCFQDLLFSPKTE